MPRCFEIFLWASPLLSLFLSPSLLPEEREANPLRSQMERPRWSKADAWQISAVTPSSMMSPQFSSIPGEVWILDLGIPCILMSRRPGPNCSRFQAPQNPKEHLRAYDKTAALGSGKDVSSTQWPSTCISSIAHPEKIFQSILWAKKDEEGKKWRCAE